MMKESIKNSLGRKAEIKTLSNWMRINPKSVYKEENMKILPNHILLIQILDCTALV